MTTLLCIDARLEFAGEATRPWISRAKLLLQHARRLHWQVLHVYHVCERTMPFGAVADLRPLAEEAVFAVDARSDYGALQRALVRRRPCFVVGVANSPRAMNAVHAASQNGAPLTFISDACADDIGDLRSDVAGEAALRSPIRVSHLSQALIEDDRDVVVTLDTRRPQESKDAG